MDVIGSDRLRDRSRKNCGYPCNGRFGGSKPSLSVSELFMHHLRPGDIFTHCFAELGSREPVVDIESKKIKPFVFEARERGIVFDVVYGGISFAFSQGTPAIEQGFPPNSISTDLHIGSMNHAMKDMLNVMSRFMAMDLKSVIEASTLNPAKEIKREVLGHLSIGAVADVAVLSVRKGRFGFFDYTGSIIEGKEKLEC